MGTALFVFVMFWVGAYYCAIIHGLRKRNIARQSQLIEEAFQKQLQKYPHLAMARLVRQKDEVRGDNAVYVLTERIYRGEDGSYWLFVCSASQPGYLTQLSPERAKNALRSTPKILAEEFPDAA